MQIFGPEAPGKRIQLPLSERGAGPPQSTPTGRNQSPWPAGVNEKKTSLDLAVSGWVGRYWRAG
ncbi:MAG: hypothetical protein ACP5H2_12440, partial [Solirubrobacteraceae bacterium]